jgi:hypothetical protein
MACLISVSSTDSHHCLQRTNQKTGFRLSMKNQKYAHFGLRLFQPE